MKLFMTLYNYRISVQTVIAVCAWLALVTIASCSKKEETELSAFKKQLSIGWKLKVASLDGQDVTSYYPNLTLNFSSTSFTSTNGVLPLWKPTVNYSIKGSTTPFIISREDGLDMTVTYIDATKLALDFQYSAPQMGGRIESISGMYHFEFIPQ